MSAMRKLFDELVWGMIILVVTAATLAFVFLLASNRMVELSGK